LTGSSPVTCIISISEIAGVVKDRLSQGGSGIANIKRNYLSAG